MEQLKLEKPNFNEELRVVTPEKKKKIADLLTDTEFFTWLEEATQNKEVTGEHNEQIYYLYEAIRLWAEKNNVYPFFDLDKNNFVGGFSFYTSLSCYCCGYMVKIGNVKYGIFEDLEESVEHGYKRFVCERLDDRFSWGQLLIDFDDVITDANLESIQKRMLVWKQLADVIEEIKTEFGIGYRELEKEFESLTYYVYTKDM